MSVARSRVRGNDKADRQMADSIAEMKAKAKLQTRDLSGGQLIGVIKHFSCVKENFVYVGVRQSQKYYKMAAAVRDTLRKSINQQPTPIK